MSNETKHAVIYCRVSTKEQVDEGNSLSTQEKICRDYALKNGYEIAHVFIEQGESAKTTERTELQNLLSYCANRKNGIDAIIAYKIDRISRNTDDYSQIRLLLKRYKVEIKSCTEFFENNPAGRFMENIIANVAQFDNDVRTERSVNGMRDAMREGRYVWKAPLGYTNAKIADKTNIIPTDIAPLITETFQQIAMNKLPVDEIRRGLNTRGLVSKRGKPLCKSYFYNLLKNETYAGWIIKFGERHKGCFKPLVTEEVYQQVQRVLKYRGRRSTQYLNENPNFPLRRFISHPTGYKLTGGWSKGKYKKYAYYCFQKAKLNFSKDLLENHFKDFLDSFSYNEDKIAKLQRFVKENLIDVEEENGKEKSRLEASIKHLKEKQGQLITKNLEGVIGNEMLRHQLEVIDRELLSLNASLLNIPEKNLNFDKLLEFVIEFLRKPSAIWERASFSLKLRLQVFKFPQGVVFDGVNFRTPELCNLFKAKSVFFDPESSMVPLRLQTSNSFDLRKNNQKSSMVPLRFQSSNTPVMPKEEVLALYEKHTTDPATLKIKAFREEMVNLAAIVEAVNKPVEEQPLSFLPNGS